MSRLEGCRRECDFRKDTVSFNFATNEELENTSQPKLQTIFGFKKKRSIEHSSNRDTTKTKERLSPSKVSFDLKTHKSLSHLEVIPTEIMPDEGTVKTKKYNFEPLVKQHLGWFITRNNSPNHCTSQYFSSTAPTANTANKTQSDAEPKKMMLTLHQPRKSINGIETKLFKPRTMIATPTAPPREILTPITIKDKRQADIVCSDSQQPGTSFIHSNKSSSNQEQQNDINPKDSCPESISDSKSSQSVSKSALGGTDSKPFHYKVSFSQLLSNEERLTKELAKSDIRNGEIVTIFQLIFESGTIYEGDIRKNKFHGEGTFSHHSGYSIKGTFVDGKVCGKAILRKGATTYVGEWLNNMPHGFGVETVEGVYVYEGSFVDGFKNGKGKMIIHSRGRYEGEFRQNTFHGQGTFSWNDGRKYTGGWFTNSMCGRGVMTWPDGRKYEGRYIRNKKDGQGVFTWADGRVFSGNWKEGKQDGQGKYTNIMGDKDQADWREGTKNQKSQVAEDK